MQLFEQTEVKVDLFRLIVSRLLICANSGAGKSYAVRKLLEAAANEVMAIVLDVEGEFRTLRERFDFLLIGPNGDLPVSMKAATLLPQKLLDLHVSTIIDISDLKKGERIQYVKKFLEALMELPKQYWKPCLVVVDEAHMYCGQQEKQDSTYAVIDLMTRGRKRGFCGVLCTQRIAKLHKDAAAEGKNYLVGGTSLDVDMKRAADILGFTSKDDVLSLNRLDPGEFYIFGPAISKLVQRVKIAPVVTTHPEVGMDLRNKVTPPTPRVKEMLAKLANLPQEAEERAKTMEDLRQRVRDLERQLRVRPAPQIDAKQIEAAEQRGYTKSRRELESQLRQASDIIKKHGQIFQQVAKLVTSGTPEMLKIAGPIQVASGPLPAKGPIPVVRPARPVTRAVEGEVSLGRCERAILSLLYNNPERQFKKTMVALFVGYSSKSSGFANALSSLHTSGLIQRNGAFVQISAQGIESAPDILGDDINLHEGFTIENWAGKLDKCPRLIFQFLRGSPDRVFSREEVAEATGYSAGSSGFANALSTLHTLGLIARVGKEVQFNPEVLEG